MQELDLKVLCICTYLKLKPVLADCAYIEKRDSLDVSGFERLDVKFSHLLLGITPGTVVVIVLTGAHRVCVHIPAFW